MDTETKQFLYHHVAKQLTEQIRLGAFPRGRLPTEAELKQQYDVSIVTVRKAIAVLEAEGLVERRQGSGTFIKHWKSPKAGSRFKKTGLIDYIPCAGSEYVPGSFYNFLMQSVQKATLQQSYNCVISPPELKRVPMPVLSKRVDGIMLAGNYYPHDITQDIPNSWEEIPSSIRQDNDQYVYQLACSGLPLLAIANYTKHADVHAVRADFDSGYYAAIDCLKALGHQRIAYVGGDDRWPEFQERSASFIRQLEKHALRRDAKTLLTYASHGGYQHDQVVQLIKQALEVRERPTALIVGTGGIAKVEEAAQALGLRIPSDLSLIVVSEASPAAAWSKDWQSFSGINADTSCLEIQVQVMAQLAVERLMSLINGHEHQQRLIMVPLTFHHGGTIARNLLK